MRDFKSWAQTFYRTPDWAVSLEDYVGPFPVGGVQYRPKETMMLKRQFLSIRQRLESGGEPAFQDVTPQNEQGLRIIARPKKGIALAFSNGDLIATCTPLGLFRDPASHVRGAGSQIYRALSAAGSKKPDILDYSIAGFFTRRNAHALILSDALSAGKRVPERALRGYEIADGVPRLVKDYGPEEHNDHWDIRPTGQNAHLSGLDWYDLRNHLRPDMTFRDTSGDVVRLLRRVEGDGTQWEVADWGARGWSYEGSTIEPGDLYERISDPAEEIRTFETPQM